MKKSIFLALVLGGGVSLSAQAMQTKDQQEEPETQILLNDEEKNDEEDNNDDTKYSTEEQFANRIGDRPVYASAYEITFRWEHNKLIANVEDTTDEDDGTKVYQVKLQPGFSVDRFMQLVEDRKEYEQLKVDRIVWVGNTDIADAREMINETRKNVKQISENVSTMSQNQKATSESMERARESIKKGQNGVARISNKVKHQDHPSSLDLSGICSSRNFKKAGLCLLGGVSSEYLARKACTSPPPYCLSGIGGAALVWLVLQKLEQ